MSPNTCFWPSRNNETIRALAITSGTNPFLITTTTSAKDAITIFSFGLLQGNLPVDYTSPHHHALHSRKKNDTEKPKCRRATIAVRPPPPRATAPSAAAAGRARALPAWRAAALAARRGSWLVATHAASNLGVATARPQALARADGGTRGPYSGAPSASIAPAWRHRGGPGSLLRSRARGAAQHPGGPASVRVEAGLPRCGATRRPRSPACWARSACWAPT